MGSGFMAHSTLFENCGAAIRNLRTTVHAATRPRSFNHLRRHERPAADADCPAACRTREFLAARGNSPYWAVTVSVDAYGFIVLTVVGL